MLFSSLLVLRHSQMVGTVIAALKPTFNVDSLAHAVLLVGGAPQGLAGRTVKQGGVRTHKSGCSGPRAPGTRLVRAAMGSETVA